MALPFLALMVPREEWKRAGLVFAGVLAVGILPFLIADPGAFYDDTVKYGAGHLQDRGLRPVGDPGPARASSTTATAATRSR